MNGEQPTTTEAPNPDSPDAVTDWRCPQMSRHMGSRAAQGSPVLPAPCPECYSVRIVEHRIPLDLTTVMRHHRWITLDPSLRTGKDDPS